MNKLKLLEYEAKMTESFSGVIAVTNSLLSARFNPVVVPFTKNDLHQLYDYFKSAFKCQIEKNDNFTDQEKEKRKHELEMILHVAEDYDKSKMTSDPYYPLRPWAISVSEKTAFYIMADSIFASLKKILYK